MKEGEFMKYSLLKLGSIALIVAAVGLIVSIACGTSDEEAAPTPDVAKIIQDAVNSVPQGASAAEIQNLVSDSVASALANQPTGVTRAEVEAAVNAASAGQLSAADVQRIVDQSIRNLPAPEPAEIDVGQLRSLVQQSVAASVPEGVSAADINRMVQAAVGAVQAGAVTRGDLEDLVAKSIQEVAGDQLTAAQVQEIVDASQAATQAAVDASLEATQAALDASLMETQSAVDASLAASQKSVDSALMETQSSVEQAAMAAKAAQEAAEMAASEAAMAVIEPVQPYGKPLGVGGYFDYRFTGPKPTTFQESPMSAELVRQGQLPPLMERLPVPEDVHVVPPPNEIGTYGGTWRATRHNQRYLQQYANGHPLQLNADGASYVERVAKGMDHSEDGRVYTFFLRRGGKWSGGSDLTSEDFRFTWEDINYYNNAASKAAGLSGNGLGPDTPYSRARDPVTGEGARFAVIDDYTFSFTFDSPNYTFFAGTTSARGPVSCGSGWCWYTSDEYAKQFHEKYADSAALAKMVADGEFEDWTKLFQNRVSWTRCGSDCIE
ncbi:MAG: ABC transporter substrate-binding protein, partial [Boseongicola sp.]|nr:ABC transporter substrate-binding protein [Boseongicola sp.]